MKISVKNSRFLVTGAAGFLGSHMCDYLLSRGAIVFGVDDMSNGKKENITHLKKVKNFRFKKCDVNDLTAVSRCLKEFRPQYVLHYAAMVGVKRTSREPLKVLEDFEGIKNIAFLSEKYRVKKVLFTSSSEVYGEPHRLPVRESDAGHVIWPYSLVKFLGETYFLAWSKKSGIPVTIVRFFNAYGPRQDSGDSGFVVSIFVTRALCGKPLEILDSGKQTRDFVYVDDNIRLTAKAFLSSKADNRPINIGSGKSVTIKQLAKKVQSTVGEVGIKMASPRSRGEIVNRQPNVTFMKRILKDHPKTDLRTGLKKTAEYFRKLAYGRK